MIKLMIFDLDGVLVNTKEIHYEALNQALAEVSPTFVINREEHLNFFDGKTTAEKLTFLSANKGLPQDKHSFISERKKEITYKLSFASASLNFHNITALQRLKNEGLKIYVASNADRYFVKMMLLKSGLLEFIDVIFSRDELTNAKPHPEIYMRCMLHAGVSPKETLVLEDSLTGIQAAHAATTNVMVVESTSDVTYENIRSEINRLNASQPKPTWLGRNVDIVIPMAGAGSRFAKAGFTLPKPMIDVLGKPMIQVSTEYLRFPNARFIFIVQKQHNEDYRLTPFLRGIYPNCEVVEVDGLTEGAACTVLAAKHLINNDRHMVIANCDQYIDFNCATFMYEIINRDANGGVVSFKAPDRSTKWSYAKLNDHGFITDIQEKKPISDIATAGVYHFRNGSDFVRAAELMIQKNIRVNNEFYVAPVYNELIAEGAKIINFYCDSMYGLGTPEDLEIYLEKNK